MIYIIVDALDDMFLNIEQKKEEISLILLIFIPLLLIIVLFVQPFVEFQKSGYVVQKQYAPSETHVGVGSGVDSGGNPKTIVTTSVSSEKWVIVLLNDGKYESVRVSPYKFYSVEENTFVSFQCLRGKWIKIVNCEK